MSALCESDATRYSHKLRKRPPRRMANAQMTLDTGKSQAALTVAMAFVLAYALGRFAGVAFDNMRNIVFERVGQDATRHLAENVFARLHRLSLRFHLARRTGEVTKTIDRGTKSIDTMLYFMLFNIAPTVIELIAVA
jgi:ABC-type multidrug transport system fused ATPase/permease subunit